MKFLMSGTSVTLENEGENLTCTLKEFLELEPELNYVPNAQEIWEGSLADEEVITTFHTVIRNGNQGPAELPNRGPYVLKIAEYKIFLVPPEPTPLTLEEARAQVQSQIRAKANAIRNAITQEVSAAEAGAWTNKEAEARIIQEGGTLPPGSMLGAEAEASDRFLGELAERVLTNAESWKVLEGKIAGNSSKHRAAVAVLGSVEEILDYDWSTGWPEVEG